MKYHALYASFLLLYCGFTLAQAQETVLYSFGTNGSNDGYGPSAGVVFDSAGNLYGTTREGGSNCEGFVSGGCGTVHELSPAEGGQ